MMIKMTLDHYIKFPQMSGYAKFFENNNKTMSFKFIDKKTVKKVY